MADRVGQRLGNYRLIRLIGQGGFADVYLAEHVYLKTQAAIKVLQTRIVNKDLEDFLSEARTIAGLAHPHIVRIIDFGVEDGTPFLVMEYAAHGTLRDRHPKGTTLAATEIVSYVKQAAMALQYAHDKKLIHRDIKPENMLLGSNEEMLLSDFGIALAAQSSRYQSTKEIIGTAAYMAPEQFQGKPRPASDQYALGIVVYEWLCGDRPFHGTFTELYGQHMFVPPPPLREKNPTIHPDVEQVVLTTLRKEPHQRFSSMRAFANALIQACDPTQLQPTITNVLPVVSVESTLANTQVSQPIEPDSTATPASQPLLPTIPVTSPSETPRPAAGDTLPGKSRAPRRISRRTSILVLAGVMMAGLTGTEIGLLLWRATHNEVSAPISTPTATSVSSPTAPPTTSPTATSASSPTAPPTTSPTATSTSSPTATSTSPSTATPISTPTAAPPPPTTLVIYRGHSASVTSVSWSPDGTRIVSTGLDTTIQVWNALQGGNSLITYSQNGSGFAVWSVVWSPDGNSIAAAGADQTAKVWDVIRGGNPIVYTGHHDQVTTLAWSPTNSQLIASGSGDTTVQVWNALQGGNPLLTLTGHTQSITSVAWSPNGRYIAAGSSDQTVLVWNAMTGGNPLIKYTRHSDQVKGVAWSPDSTRIASGSYDKTVQVWDALSGTLLLTYSGHTDHVNPVDWSPNGRYIASGSWDTTVQVWDASSGAHLFSYRGHSDHVNSVKWSPDGKLIASGSLDTTAQVWRPF